MATTLIYEKEATFGGQLFIRPDDRNLLTCDMSASPITTITVPLVHAFLCPLDGCWTFVGGYEEGSIVRNGFLDDTTDRDQNAAALAALGVPMLDLDSANANLREGELHVVRMT